ncbi:MAG: EAL domain-containing protein [Pseudomonadota bacterium]|nr:EAL domain-containing protein [Pseudomonadota bacterium]
MSDYLSGQYNPMLVVVSYLVAVLASFAALQMVARINASRPGSTGFWLGFGALVMGSGIWSMHFIGMLSFSLPIALGYDLWITLLSLLVAVISSAFALHIVSGAELPAARLLYGAVVMGLGIAAMHYIGMSAMRMAPGIDYHPGWFAASIVIAIAAAGAALWIAFALRREVQGNSRLRMLASLVMGVAIIGMHYTGMAAARFPAGSMCGATDGQGISTTMLTVLTGGASLALFVIMMVASQLDRRVQIQTSALEDSLQRANDELAFISLHDPVTQLPNRTMLEDRLKRDCHRARRSGDVFAVMMVDLDGFKNINDVYGHPLGDSLLRNHARVIQSMVRAEDTVARIGADEFVVVTDLADPSDAASVARTVLEAIARPVVIEGIELRVTASIGIALFGTDADEPRALISCADAAMYAAKDMGRNEFCYFEASMTRGTHAQLAMIQDLRLALENNQLSLHYQPKFSANDSRLSGVEALLRWSHPSRGPISPMEFIPLAEKTGMILEIGRWVIVEACRQFMQWREQGLVLDSVAINLSAAQFRSPDLFAKINAALERHDMPPSCLVLEVTESTAMHNPEASLDILRRLVGLGVRISIDDFGTGYSSLLYLKRLPASELKIDRGFVRDLAAGSEDEAIVSAIIALGRTLKLDIIAEGVETDQQRQLLASLGCTSLQGFLLARPMPPTDLLARYGSVQDQSLDQPGAGDHVDVKPAGTACACDAVAEFT